MKKTMIFFASILVLSGMGATTFACLDIDFGSKSVCVNIDKNDDDEYELDVDTNDYSSYSSSNAYYYVLLPNKTNSKNSGGGKLTPRLTSSNRKFEYDYRDYDYDNDTRKIKVYAIINNVLESIEAYYDFDDGDWSDEEDSSSTSDGDLDNFYITLSDSTPAEDDEITLTIKARDDDNSTLSDYDGSNAEITIKYRTSSNGSRYTAGSSYVDIDDETPTFSNGIAETDITFKYEYEYRITVTDDDEDIEDYKDIDVGDSSSTSDGDLDNFYITLSDSTPAEDDEVTLTIKARDDDNSTLSDYDGSNAEITVKYRTSSNGSRYTAGSSYVDIEDKTPTFNNGIAKTDITFKNEYEYRIIITDDDEDIEDYKDIDVDNNSSSSTTDDFYLSANNNSPDTNEWIDLTIEARDGSSTNTSYRGKVKFKIYYRSSSSSSWTLTTSSTYYEIDNDYEDGYRFTYSDDGKKTLNDLIRFKKKYEYKVLVQDIYDTNINSYILIDLNQSKSNIDGFTQGELDTVTKLYNTWKILISNMKSDYSRLRTNNTWIEMSDDFYDDMKEVINDTSNRNFSDYDDFKYALIDRYDYTVDHR